MNDLIRLLDKTARLAGELATHHQQRPADLRVEAKGPLDFVTAADKAVEQGVVEAIRKAFPDDSVLGEEGSAYQGNGPRLWVIDPIDGTANYMRGLPWWSISIGLVEDGQPKAGIIHAPAMDITIVAVKGGGVVLNGQPVEADTLRQDPPAPVIMTGSSPASAAKGDAEKLSVLIRSDLNGIERRLGCGTASLLQVLLGKADLYIGLGERIWDVCAAAVIAEELGLRHSVQWKAAADPQPFNFACGVAKIFEKVNRRSPPDTGSAYQPWQAFF
ncbi:inositol monophosphatase family protein [Rhizobium sp. NFACC06-2]|uniref:inositol monophosphatase family protein n=1 Tax=Rhizobium sp. NFACC06-2 TaxID=1566264 RepID=UPI0008768577|nr:inositol monophosphatase family protein [Rhizobium sp. NFACC06-2]SCY91041.1 myo-inositol-1(or 4)-monophosphatase [Rhizobium sp. NFACC06-2]